MEKSGRGMSERMMLVILGILFMGVLAILWAIVTRPVGIMYHLVRTVESLGTWYLTPWGISFHNLTLGKDNDVRFIDIYTSSIPFGIIAALIVVYIGYRLKKKAQNEHLSSIISHEKTSPPDWKSIMRRQAILYPANQFFLDYAINDFADLTKGVARMPYTAIDVILRSGAYRGTKLVDGQEALECDRSALTTFLSGYMGELNPFFTARTDYTISSDPMPSNEIIADIINNSLKWHHCIILYPALFRIYGSLVDTGQEFSYFIENTEGYFKDVWRDINRLKKNKRDSLVIGFQDENDEKFKRALFREKHGEDATLFTLMDYLNSEAEGQTGTIGDNLPTVITARQKLIELLTSHRHKPDHIPAGKDKKKGLIYKKQSELMDSERILSANILSQQLSFIKHISPILLKRAYTATMLAASLDTETGGARSLGVLAPAQFRWVRFYDHKLWLFIRAIGGKTAVPEAAGVFQHYLDEKTTQQPIINPQLDRAVEAIINEANNYITPEAKERLEREHLEMHGSPETKREKAARVVHQMTQDALSLLPSSNNE